MQHAGRGAALFGLLALSACGSDAVAPPETRLDLDALFAPATAAEIAAVRADWAGRSTVPADPRMEATEPFSLGGVPATLRVVSHAIPGGRHYGAVIAADDAGPGTLPVLVYAHGGEEGVEAGELGTIAQFLGEVTARFVWVLPSYRSETLTAAGRDWTSGGEASPWDRDVDDALTLLDAAIAATPAADPERIGVLGFSRGGGVALLMGTRDARIDRLVEFFGPTDFFGAYVREVVEETLAGDPRDLPGLDFLDRRFLQPLAAGATTTEAVRIELVRRSAVLFAGALPPLQIHHGTADEVVDVSQARSLISTLEALGDRPEDGYFVYEGGRHDLFSLPGSVGRTLDFMGRLAGP